MNRLFTNCILFVLCSSPIFSQDLNTKKLDFFFDSLEHNNQVMGSFAVAKAGKIIYTRYIGFSNINAIEKSSSSSETKYRVGSVTKMFTATMIMQLVEEGKISSTTTLDTYYPQIPNSNKITIEMLLRHRSGLYDYVNGSTDPDWIKKIQSRDTIIDAIIKGPIQFMPNKRFAYNNSGFYLLGCIIEKITGQTYNENLQKRICSKLEMTMTYSPPNNERSNNDAVGYKFENGMWVEISDNYFPNIVGVGDVISTPIELIKFIDALLDDKLISHHSVALMKEVGGNNGFGLGLMRIPFFKKVGYGHRGDTFGSHTMVAKFSDEAFTVVSCVNGQNFKLNDITVGILSIIYNEDYTIPVFTQVAN